jgi:hypothetical protein
MLGAFRLVRGRVWLLSGLIFALVPGSAMSSAVRRPGGGFIRPPVPPRKIDPKKITDEQKKRAGALVDKYMTEPTGTSAAEEKKIDKLIKDFGSDEYAVREAASREILKCGAKALKKLQAALKSKDAEVVQRAEAAIAAVKKTGGNTTVAELRKLYYAAVHVVSERRKKWEQTAYTAELQAIALEAQEKKEAAKEKRKIQAAAEKKVARLKALAALLTPASRPVPRPIRKLPIFRPLPGVIRGKAGGGLIIIE